MTLQELMRPTPKSPLRCDVCGKYTRSTNLTHEYGDYGSILNSEVICPSCVQKGK